MRSKEIRHFKLGYSREFIIEFEQKFTNNECIRIFISQAGRPALRPDGGIISGHLQRTNSCIQPSIRHSVQIPRAITGRAGRINQSGTNEPGETGECKKRRADKGDTNEAGNVNTTKQGIANKDVNAGRPIKNWRKSNLLAGAGIIGRAVPPRPIARSEF